MSQTEELVQAVEGLAGAANKILLVTGKPGSGKSKVLREAADEKGWEYVDCRLLITEAFLELLPKERTEQAAQMIGDVLAAYNSEVILLDRLQTFFVPVFHIDIEDLMKKLGERFTIVAAWPGYVEGSSLCYDKFDGTESIKLPINDIKVLEIE